MKKHDSLPVLLISLLCLAFLSCERIDGPSGEPNPLDGRHFDIWASVGGTYGMGSDNALLVYSSKSLETEEVVDFRGTGVDVTAKLFQETAIDGAYYVQIPREKDRFGKYRIGTSGIEISKELSFARNTYRDRRYAHTWIGDHTLLVLAANGEKDSIIWTKINTADMRILAEGTLSGLSDTLAAYSTSGLASYRASDDMVLYSYCHSKSRSRAGFYMAFIHAADMTVEKCVEEDRAAFMAGTAYGQLLQSKSFFDENGDYYLACNTIIEGAARTTMQYGSLLRIKDGETEFDKNYLGYSHASNHQGKLVTVESLGRGKALLYIQDPEYTGAEWGSDYNCYYAVLDLASDEITVLDLPFNEGTFSQRSVVVGDKAYIGVNPKDAEPCVYVYDIESGGLTRGLVLAEGYAFNRIVLLGD